MRPAQFLISPLYSYELLCSKNATDMACPLQAIPLKGLNQPVAYPMRLVHVQTGYRGKLEGKIILGARNMSADPERKKLTGYLPNRSHGFSLSFFNGTACQIFSQYSPTARSDENFPIRATVRIDILVQFLLSLNASLIRSWQST